MAEREHEEEVEEMVKLQSSEGEVFQVPIKVAKVSRTLAVMLTDLGHQPDDLIPLPNVNSSILKKVLGWAEHSLDDHTPPPQATHTVTVDAPSSPTAPTSNQQLPIQPRPQPHVPQRPASRRLLPPPSHTLSAWEKEFLTRNKDSIYDLLLAANYLDMKSLLDVLCRVVADMIKGRDPQAIRRVFHAPDPLGDWVAGGGERLSYLSTTSTQDGSNSSASSESHRHSDL